VLAGDGWLHEVKFDGLPLLCWSASGARLSLSEAFEDGMASLRVAEQCGLEGVVSKRRDTTLPIGRVAAAALKASADLSGNVRPNSFRVDESTAKRAAKSIVVFYEAYLRRSAD